ncbi:MAG: tyrosine-protein kinase family protein [Gemmataceae bacterium]
MKHLSHNSAGELTPIHSNGSPDGVSTSSKLVKSNASPSSGNNQEKLTPLALLKALRRHGIRALLIGLLVGAIVSTMIWFVVPPTRNSAVARLRVSSTRVDVLGGKHKDKDFHLFRQIQVGHVKSREVISHALDQPKVKKLKYVRSKVDPVIAIEEAIKVGFDSSPENMKISLEGDDIGELKILVDAIANSYLLYHKNTTQREMHHRIAELNRIRAEKEEALQGVQRELLELALIAKGANLQQLDVQQQLQTLLLTWIMKEVLRTKTKKLEVEAQIQKSFRSHHLPRLAHTLGSPGCLSRLSGVYLLYTDPETKLTELRTPWKAKEFPVAGRMSQVHREKKSIDEQIKAIRRTVKPDKARPIIAVLEARLEFLDLSQPELFEESKPTESSHQKPRPLHFTDLLAELNDLKDQQKSLQEEITNMGVENQARIKTNLRMEILRAKKEDIEHIYKKARDTLLGMEMNKNGPPRVSLMGNGAVGYPPPTFGKREMYTVAGGVGCLFFVLFAFAWFEYKSRRIGCREDVARSIGLHPIGSLPDFTRSQGFQVWGKPELNTDDLLVDSVDAVRTMVLSASMSENLQMFLVTSAQMGEGKTSTAGHLAASLARGGKKTLLIDFDLRNPSLHRLFDASISPGVSELLNGECDVLAAVQPLPTNNLFLMSSGNVTRHTLNCISLDVADQSLKQLRAHFDFIILDSSPVLAVPESLVLANYADAVIFSVLRDVSKLPTVHRATELLNRLNARIMGFIMNGVRDFVPHVPRLKKDIPSQIAP